MVKIDCSAESVVLGTQCRVPEKGRWPSLSPPACISLGNPQSAYVFTHTLTNRNNANTNNLPPWRRTSTQNQLVLTSGSKFTVLLRRLGPQTSNQTSSIIRIAVLRNWECSWWINLFCFFRYIVWLVVLLSRADRKFSKIFRIIHMISSPSGRRSSLIPVPTEKMSKFSGSTRNRRQDRK